MKVVIVDDHEFVRVGVRELLTTAPEYQVVGEAATAADAFDVIDRVTPDIIVMDLVLPGTDGIRATREILRRTPKTRVLILSAHDQISDVIEAFAAGACGYALKGEAAEALLDALRVVSRGDRYVPPALASRLAKLEQGRRRSDDVLGMLSGREREIFLLAAECMNARDIATKVGIARKTVDTHLNRVHRKLGLSSPAELVRLAVSLGLLQLSLAPRVGERRERKSRAPGEFTDGSTLVRPGTVLLVIDDDVEVRGSIADLLTMEGYDARPLASAEAAWAALENGAQPAAIILDLWLPGMTSGEFVRKLRASRHAAIPVLVLSGTRANEAIGLDIDAVSEKPMEATTLVRAVDKVVRLGPRRAPLTTPPRSEPASKRSQ